MSVASIDDKDRVVLKSDVRAISGMRKGMRVLLVPSRGRIEILLLDGSFSGCLDGFGYAEERHEASKFIFKR
ncbi:TPA: hypothetical protein EYP44_00630 [Candidatus Bathyarchaeota archaeon]|nr:hypothetical protein [Candidatus Bathyarchaeota archaeon]